MNRSRDTGHFSDKDTYRTNLTILKRVSIIFFDIFQNNVTIK